MWHAHFKSEVEIKPLIVWSKGKKKEREGGREEAVRERERAVTLSLTSCSMFILLITEIWHAAISIKEQQSQSQTTLGWSISFIVVSHMERLESIVSV